MSHPIDLQKIERQVWRASQQDGLLEIMIGVVLAATAGQIHGRGCFVPWFFLIVFMAPVLEAIRSRITYPRTGYVELAQEEPKKTLRGMALYTMIVTAALALALIIFGEFRDLPAQLRRWSPTLAGLVMSGGMIYAASKSGAARYYGFVVLLVGLGVVFSILFPASYGGLTLYLLTMGALFFLCGTFLLIGFLRRYPLPAEEDTHVIG